MKVRVIDKNYIELERSEIIVELTVVISYWLFNVTKVYRKVHGEYFLYNDSQYTTLSTKRSRDVATWYKLPEDLAYKVN